MDLLGRVMGTIFCVNFSAQFMRKKTIKCGVELADKSLLDGKIWAAVAFREIIFKYAFIFLGNF